MLSIYNVPTDFKQTNIMQCCTAVKAEMFKLHLNTIIARILKLFV